MKQQWKEDEKEKGLHAHLGIIVFLFLFFSMRYCSVLSQN